MSKNAKTSTPVRIKLVTPKEKKATKITKYEIKNFGSLGKEIKVSPKANITVNLPGYKSEFFVETVNVVIGIGNDHVADLIMTVDAWNALKKGAKISITTTKQFKDNFL